MRTRIWLCGMIVAVATFGSFSYQSAVTAPAVPAKPEAQLTQDDRDDLASKLMERVNIAEPMKNITLKQALDFLGELKEVTILVDHKSFATAQGMAVALNGDEESVMGLPVSLPAAKKIRFATILKHVLDQVDAVALLYPDHIKIVGTNRAQTLTNPNLKAYGSNDLEDPAVESVGDIVRSIPLVNVNFAEKTLEGALKEIEVRTNRTIVLAPQGGDKAKTLVTARFTNVPVDTAVTALAEMAGLKMARRGSVLLVTTAERAKEFDPPAPFGVGGGFLSGLSGFPYMPADGVEDLKKRVAELEKTIVELKKEKK